MIQAEYAVLLEATSAAEVHRRHGERLRARRLVATLRNASGLDAPAQPADDRNAAGEPEPCNEAAWARTFVPADKRCADDRLSARWGLWMKRGLDAEWPCEQLWPAVPLALRPRMPVAVLRELRERRRGGGDAIKDEDEEEGEDERV